MIAQCVCIRELKDATNVTTSLWRTDPASPWSGVQLTLEERGDDLNNWVVDLAPEEAIALASDLLMMADRARHDNSTSCRDLCDFGETSGPP